MRLLPKEIARIALVVAALCIIPSCNKEETIIDSIPPKVSIAGISNNQLVWGIVPLTLEVADNDQITKAEFFLDNLRFATILNEPFISSWNTIEYNEGLHIIKAVVTDATGNQGMTEVIVTIRNVLISVTIPEKHLSPSTRGFIFLSDADGEFIAGTEYKNKQTVSLKAPEFNGEHFYLTEVEINEIDALNWTTLYTYMEVPRGPWYITLHYESSDELNEPIYTDTAYLNFNNGIPGYFYDLKSNGLAGRVDTGHLSDTLALMKSPSNLYISAYDENGSQKSYRLLSSITAGLNPTIDLSAINLPFEKGSVHFPSDVQEGQVNVSGITKFNDHEESYEVGNYLNKNGTAEILIPGNSFASYLYSGGYTEHDHQYYLSSRMAIDIIPFPYKLSIELLSDKIIYTATGNFDYPEFCLTKERTAWFYYVKKGTSVPIPKFHIPTFLTELADLNLPQMGHYESLYEYEELSNYEDLIAYIKSNKGVLYNFEDWGKNYKVLHLFDGDRPSGRGY
jgi:hypothetical protein